MAVKITNECIGCGSCESVCPFGAISMKDDKAVIGDACTQCGACIETCPVGAIEREKGEKHVAMDKTEYKNVWVYVEVAEGKPEKRGTGTPGTRTTTGGRHGTKTGPAY